LSLAVAVSVLIPLNEELAAGDVIEIVGATVSTVSSGVMEAEGAEALPVPIALVAVTVNVYGIPFVRPEIVIGEPVPVAVLVPGLAVMV
jgi:hypothetical protein